MSKYQIISSLVDGFIIAYSLNVYLKDGRFVNLMCAVVVAMIWAAAVFGRS